MTLDNFWKIIADVQRDSCGDFGTKCELLDTTLRKLPLAEVRSFNEHFTDSLDRAYNHKLWGAAYVIGGGCGDDGFWDFRSTLISMGREIFERALADPESLADVLTEDESLQYEGFQSVAYVVTQDLSGGQEFPRARPHPENPTGEKWDEETVGDLFPKLAEKFHYE